MTPLPSPAAMADPRHGFVAFADTSGDVADRACFLRVLESLVRGMRLHRIEYALIGGIASTAHGRERHTHDIDVFVRPADADRVLVAMTEIGFETQRTDPNWIFKCFRDGVIIDVIFKAKGGIYFDDAMLARCRTTDFGGVSVVVAPPEDLIVMKAIASDDDSPRHWFDALGLIAEGGGQLDWLYLLDRARLGPRRLLSLLLYAQADDLPVPTDVVPALFELIHPNSNSRLTTGMSSATARS